MAARRESYRDNIGSLEAADGEQKPIALETQTERGRSGALRGIATASPGRSPVFGPGEYAASGDAVAAIGMPAWDASSRHRWDTRCSAS